MTKNLDSPVGCRHLKTLRDSVKTVCCDCGTAVPHRPAVPVPDFYGVFSFPKCPIPGCPERLGDGQTICSPHFIGLPSPINLKLLFPSTREKAVAEAIAFYEEQRKKAMPYDAQMTAQEVNSGLLGKVPDHIHFNDPRYPQWLKVYEILVSQSPAALRESLKLSAGTLASRIVNELFPSS